MLHFLSSVTVINKNDQSWQQTRLDRQTARGHQNDDQYARESRQTA